jgi:hypothetical protein
MSLSRLLELDEETAKLPVEEQQTLMKRIAERLNNMTAAKPRSLRGIWEDKFPEEFDVESALREIRSGWIGKIE